MVHAKVRQGLRTQRGVDCEGVSALRCQGEERGGMKGGVDAICNVTAQVGGCSASSCYGKSKYLHKVRKQSILRRIGSRMTARMSQKWRRVGKERSGILHAFILPMYGKGADLVSQAGHKEGGIYSDLLLLPSFFFFFFLFPFFLYLLFVIIGLPQWFLRGGLGRWVPPAMTAAGDGSHQTAAQRGGDKVKEKDLPLSDVLRDKCGPHQPHVLLLHSVSFVSVTSVTRSKLVCT